MIVLPNNETGDYVEAVCFSKVYWPVGRNTWKMPWQMQDAVSGQHIQAGL